jgi:RNA polymerase sigma-70 factor (ECF subfamily)
MLDRTKVESLIARVALGDQAAFSALYDATSGKLFGVCMRILKDRSSAEDALQDTFIKIWKNSRSYSANGLSPMTWLITIARNTSIDRLRMDRSFDDFDTIAHRISATGLSPEQSAIASSEAKRIVACLNELDAQRSAAIQGAYLDGQSYVDLSERFNVPLNTMRTWLRRALISLKECMSR